MLDISPSHIRVVWYGSVGEVQRPPSSVIHHVKLAHPVCQVYPLKPEVPTTVVFLVDARDAQIVEVSPRALPQPVHTSDNIDLWIQSCRGVGRDKKINYT